MNIRVALTFLTLAGLAGCAEPRYRSNLTHAYVTPWTHVSRQDYEAIVRLISDRDWHPIIGVSAHRPSKDGSTISVYTGNLYQTEYSFWHGYALKKENGKWRVTFHGDCSHTVASLDLTGEFRDIEKQRGH